jgi:PPIC-type PPIASE domain
MTRYTLVCLLFGSLSWGQARSLRSGVTGQQPAAPPTVIAEDTAHDLKHEPGTSNVPPDKPLITITGLCDNSSPDRGAASECKTVITRAQFEEVIEAVQPKMSPHARREFALTYADALVMTRKAEQMGLDKGGYYEEQMKLARIQILSQDLKKEIQEKVSQISEKDIEGYYQNNMARFEKAEVDRVYVPKTQQSPSASDLKLGDADRQKRSQESEQRMKEEADNLRARAVTGEEFTKLQSDAYQAAGIKTASPNTSMGIRRTSLPPTQVSVMDLKPGEVSPVLADPNGYVIYRVKTKTILPIEQAREEIKATLRSLRIQDEMREIHDSATPTLDESYFAR